MRVAVEVERFVFKRLVKPCIARFERSEFARAIFGKFDKAELLYGAEQLSDEELLDAIYTLAKSDNPQSSIRCARYRARKKLAKGSEKQKERCRSLKKAS